MSPGTHIKLLLNRLCIRTQTEEKEHSQTPTAPTAAPPFSSPLLPSPPSFTPLMLHARRRSKRGGQTMEMWMRAHSVSCPPLFSDEVAQFMFALYRRCLPHVISVTSNSLRSFRPFDTLHCTRTLRAHVQYRREGLSERLRVLDPFFKKPHWIPALLTSGLQGGTSAAQLSVLPLPPHYRCTDVCPAMRGSELSD